jgi:hypothetical protein
MTTKLESLFNLAPSEDVELTPEESVHRAEEIIEHTVEIANSITAIEKIDLALNTVTNLSEHDVEMDDIAKKAIESYNELCQLGLNVPEAHMSKIYEVAANMLNTALTAKDAKVQRKLKTIELQLKKAKLDHDISKKDPATTPDTNNEFDRNELLDMIAKGKLTK